MPIMKERYWDMKGVDQILLAWMRACSGDARKWGDEQ